MVKVKVTEAINRLKMCHFFSYLRLRVLAYPTGISVNPMGLGNVVLHEGCKTTLVQDVSMTMLPFLRHIFDVLTSFSRNFLPNISTSTYKRGAVPNFS